MPILRVQHSVPDFESWKRAFESDPVDRKGSGVHRYSVYRPVGNPNFVIVDLELETVEAAERLLEKLRRLWAGPGGAVMRSPEAQVIEIVDSKSL